MEKLVIIVMMILTSCFFGSIMHFSEKDIADAVNVVINSSFEDGKFNSEALPEEWMVLDDAAEKIIWDDNNMHTGSKCLRIEYPDHKLNIISDAFPINPEYIYYSRCFLRTNYQSNHPIIIRFLAFNAKGKRVNKFSNKGYPKEDWTQIDLTSGFLNSTARFGRIIITLPKKPDKLFWIDDVESYSVYKIQK